MSSSWVRPLAFVAVCSLSPAALAQNGGRVDDAPPPAPTYTAPPPYGTPPPTYTPPPYGGGYAAPPPPTGPKRMPYEEGDPVPAGYHVATRNRTGLLIAGGIVFGIFYGFTALGASNSTEPSTQWLYLPVAGPVIYGNTLDGEFAGVARFFLWVDALAQAGGAAMLIAGFIPKTELVRNDYATVHLTPVLGKGTTGLALTGMF